MASVSTSFVSRITTTENPLPEVLFSSLKSVIMKPWLVKRNQLGLTPLFLVSSLDLFFLVSVLLVTSCHIDCQSIPVVVNPIGSNNNPSQAYRPGNVYPPPNGPPFPSIQPQNPIASFLGNLLGGLAGSVPVNAAQIRPSGNQPQTPQIFPGAGMFNNGLPPRMMECQIAYQQNLQGSHHHGHHGSSDGPANPEMAHSNRTGYCVPSPNDCRARGGQLLGPCFRRQGGPYGPPVGPPFGACCYFEQTCGGNIFVNGSHFRSPDFPEPYPGPGSCSVNIKNTYRNTCQIRLDFVFFNLKQPIQGFCNADRLVVNGQATNDIIPSICGFNPGQHSKL